VSACVCVRVRACVCVCACVCLFVCLCVCGYGCGCLCVGVAAACRGLRLCAYLRNRTHAQLRTYALTQRHTRACTSTNTHPRIHARAHAPTQALMTEASGVEQLRRKYADERACLSEAKKVLGDIGCSSSS
jgi:hypothetical protein